MNSHEEIRIFSKNIEIPERLKEIIKETIALIKEKFDVAISPRSCDFFLKKIIFISNPKIDKSKNNTTILQKCININWIYNKNDKIEFTLK